MALVVLAERIRDDAEQTLRFFTEQGVTLKVISGDNPRTVGAVAAKVGVPGVSSAADAVDARELPDDVDQLADLLETHSAFGRVSPHQKRTIIAALQDRGHVVAMTGDGVNDALAIKDADIGVAMGNGSPATRAVAPLVLLDGKFSHLPDVVAEGRRVIADIGRAANLFVVKNVYSLVPALIAAVTLSAYPLAPIQLTLISTLTIGVPGFFLALGPNRRRYVPGFLPRVLRFALRTGVIIGSAAYIGYRAARLLDSTAGVPGGRHPDRAHRLAVDPAHLGPAPRQLEARARGDHGRRGSTHRRRSSGCHQRLPPASDTATGPHRDRDRRRGGHIGRDLPPGRRPHRTTCSGFELDMLAGHALRGEALARFHCHVIVLVDDNDRHNGVSDDLLAN